MAKKQINVMCTAFRDGFQSCYGARVFTEDFMPAVAAAKDAGLTHFEAGGGARFQSLFFYCNENAFDMMDRFREVAGPDANLQTLARGINVVGLESQSSDIIDLHAKLFKKHGMTTIRNFDALNDVNNLIYSGQCITDAGLKHEICITLMELPPGCQGAHTAEFYTEILKKIIASGVPFDSICYKDASGTAVPSKIYDTIKAAREIVGPDVHIRMHTHETAGIGVLQYKAALDAGADGIDLSLAPVSGGTCQTDIATMWHALRGSNYDLGIDIDKIIEAERVFKDCMKDYFDPPEAHAVEPLIPWSPMPGGALTANTQMLRDNGIMDKYPQIIENMSQTVKLGGFGTSVTPVSQFYFQQAFNNTMFGPWKKIADGYGKMVLGYFGKTPVAPDPEIVKIASEQLGLEPTTEDPRAINDRDETKGVAAATKLLKENNLEVTDENVFIAATCKEKGIAFLTGKATVGVRKVDPTKQASSAAPAEGPANYNVKLNGKSYAVTIDGDSAVVNGKSYQVDISEGSAQAAAPAAGGSGNAEAIKAQLPGAVFKVLVSAGDQVEVDQVVIILEAMKMEIEVKSTVVGVVADVPVSVGDQIVADQTLVNINK